MEQSIGFASEIQKCFVSAKRADRGVRQAGFLVLRKTSMPSVLVELGYISNRDEEHFMKSSDGQNKLANALFDAFTRYKKEYDRKQGGVSGRNSSSGSVTTSVETSSFADEQVEEVVAPGSEQDILNRKKKSSVSSQKRRSTTNVARTKSVTTGKIVYKVQILTSDKKLSSGAKVFKGYKNVDYFVEKGIYKYTCGETTDFDSIRKLRRQVAKDFKDAFIVAFKDGKKVKY